MAIRRLVCVYNLPICHIFSVWEAIRRLLWVYISHIRHNSFPVLKAMRRLILVLNWSHIHKVVSYLDRRYAGLCKFSLVAYVISPFSIWKAMRRLVLVNTGPISHMAVFRLESNAQDNVGLYWSHMS